MALASDDPQDGHGSLRRYSLSLASKAVDRIAITARCCLQPAVDVEATLLELVNDRSKPPNAIVRLRFERRNAAMDCEVVIYDFQLCHGDFLSVRGK